MTKKTRRLIWLLTLALCLSLFVPVPVSAADLYLTAINDTIPPMSTDTMPIKSNGALYMPYTVFDRAAATVDLGINARYNTSNNTVTLYNTRQQMLVFDLTLGTCRDEINDEYYNAKAVIRNGRPYLPLNTVCYFFGLTYSYIAISKGYLVRIKNDAVVLSDKDFIDSADNLISRRLREYSQSINPSTPNGGSSTPPASTTPPSTDTNSGETSSPSDIRTYLAFRCTDSEGLSTILDVLDGKRVYALFFLSPEMLLQESDLVRRILGTGHSVGLLAEGASPEETQALLEQGNRVLEQLFYTRTTLAYVPQDQRAALADQGWIYWTETLMLSPSQTVGANAFAADALRRLSGRTRSTFLTLEGSGSTGRILPALLQQLANNHFVINIPMETRL